MHDITYSGSSREAPRLLLGPRRRNHRHNWVARPSSGQSCCAPGVGPYIIGTSIACTPQPNTASSTLVATSTPVPTRPRRCERAVAIQLPLSVVELHLQGFHGVFLAPDPILLHAELASAKRVSELIVRSNRRRCHRNPIHGFSKSRAPSSTMRFQYHRAEKKERVRA